MDDLTRKQFLAASGATAGALWAANAMGVPGFGSPDQAMAAGKAFSQPDLLRYHQLLHVYTTTQALSPGLHMP